MSEKKYTDQEKKEKIQSALNDIDLVNLPDEITQLLSLFSAIQTDPEMLENLQKEIVKKYGE